MQRLVDFARPAAMLAVALFAAASIGFGAVFPAFSHAAHPLAALGASHVPHAVAFNVVAFVLPGLLGAFVAQALRARMGDAPIVARLGVQVLTLASIAFAMLGILPLDSSDLLSPASLAHSATWTAWWVAATAGGVLLGAGMRGTRHARRSWSVAACALAVMGFAVLLPPLLAAGVSQRLAFAAWFGVIALVAPPSRAAASAPGSSPTGRA